MFSWGTFGILRVVFGWGKPRSTRGKMASEGKNFIVHSVNFMNIRWGWNQGRTTGCSCWLTKPHLCMDPLIPRLNEQLNLTFTTSPTFCRPSDQRYIFVSSILENSPIGSSDYDPNQFSNEHRAVGVSY